MLQGSLINTALSTANRQTLSPEFAYGAELAVANQLSTAASSMGLVATVGATTQLNLNGTQRPNQFGHLGPPTAIQAFFHYFYASHPFCLPQARLLALFKERRSALLEYAVQFIGASFLAEIPADIYKEALNRTLSNGNYPHDGFTVQALLLFAIGLHASNDIPRAAQIFNMAQNLTLELGLNRSDFAMNYGNNDRVLEESWRRTWWSMYTVNGMMTAVNPGVQFRLKDIASDVPLPCENHQYFSGVSAYQTNSLQQACQTDPNIGLLGILTLLVLRALFAFRISLYLPFCFNPSSPVIELRRRPSVFMR